MVIWVNSPKFNRGWGRNALPAMRLRIAPGTALTSGTWSLYGWLTPNNSSSYSAFHSSLSNGGEACSISKSTASQWHVQTFFGTGTNVSFNQNSAGGKDFILLSNSADGPTNLSGYVNGKQIFTGSGGYATVATISQFDPLISITPAKFETMNIDGIYRDAAAAASQYASLQSFLSIDPPEVIVPSTSQTAQIMCPPWMAWRQLNNTPGITITPSSGVGPTTVAVSTAVGVAAGLYNVEIVGTTLQNTPSVANLLVDVTATCPVYSGPLTQTVSGLLTFQGNTFSPTGSLSIPGAGTGPWSMPGYTTGDQYSLGCACNDSGGLAQYGNPSSGSTAIVVGFNSTLGHAIPVNTPADAPGVLPLNYLPAGTLDVHDANAPFDFLGTITIG